MTRPTPFSVLTKTVTAVNKFDDMEFGELDGKLTISIIYWAFLSYGA